ncbi:MAG: hypothetical protein CMJ86_09715 [Planctomycetes bacterium]|jgi:L-iditol 2-dehydrogenase|nr:hypothetical protein [Planctomycetota bacterium]
MSNSTRACALVAPHSFKVIEIPLPPMGPKDVRVTPQAVGVCGTDFHIADGAGNYNLTPSGEPIPLAQEAQILGHEIVGKVVEIGSAVHDIQVGQSVVLDQGLSCISHYRTDLCEYCSSGASHQCETYTEYGITGLAGGFSEELIVPAINVLETSGARSPSECALTEPLACMLHTTGMLNDARQRYTLKSKDAASRVHTILIMGAGPAGLLMTQVLRGALGFEGTLLVSEPNPYKRTLVASFGAEVWDANEPGIEDWIQEKSDGRMLEWAFEASGAGPAFASMPRLLRKQATVIKYGIGHQGQGLELLNDFHWKEPTFLMPVGASSPFDQDGRATYYRQALEWIESGKVQVEPLITHRYAGLEQVPQALGDDHKDANYVKGIVEFQV